MRIDLNYRPQPTPENDRSNAQSAASAAALASPVQPGEDQAQLSGAHTQVEALTAQAAQLPEIRQERVASLRPAVEAHKYHPDQQKTAGALVAHMMFGSAT
jgi:flagellar biosynthesis anti-sigma factor FlgM